MAQELLSKIYNPKAVENKWYSFWLEKGYFKATIDKGKEPFAIVIPPPNVTGSLHIGHALNNTLQDALVRKKRMEGLSVLWLPGTDHAGIATQNVVEKQLAKEGLKKEDLGREKFIEQVWQWKEKYGSTIINQLKRIGCSCDWGRERFTMDEGYSDAVKTVFVKLYKEGLIYKGHRVINWCPRCLTALSDIEVEHEDIEGHLWYIKYPFKDSNEYLTVATTRPETMLGDVAVAVHPEDPRYKQYIGKILILPGVGREIPVIVDEAVDPNFGTGAVKITPAHDPNDFELGLRHKLEQINIFTPDAKINENGENYLGMDRYGCREAIVMDLERAYLLEKVEPHFHAVGHCYRCHTVVEPYLSEQWFVEMKSLAKPAIKAVEDDRINFVPKRWEKVYFNWMNNLQDWCISRQIWWGHQIPAWYCECGEINVSIEKLTKCSKCGSNNLKQETDVLDTWFSSALWPFATLGWPEETDDLKYFYPTSVLSTARDIIYLWVARMNMMGLKFMKDVPYRTVIIHPTVLTIGGKRMSKSLGTGIDPLELIEKYGTDATRFGLMFQAQAQDMRFSEEKIEMSRNFANKIWNASRFILMNLDGYSKEADLQYEFVDKWILSRFTKLLKNVNADFETFNLSFACKQIYDFFWGEFCDWYLELCKGRLYQKDAEGDGEKGTSRQTAQHVLCFVMDNVLKLLHPFMPFITEEIWQKFSFDGESIMVASWPEENKSFIDDKLEDDFALIKAIVVEIRSIRSMFSLPFSKRIDVIIKGTNETQNSILRNNFNYISELANISNFSIGQDIKRPPKSASAITHGFEIFVPLAGLIDVKKEEERLSKKLDKIEEDLIKIQKKLSRDEFLTKAPVEVVKKEKAKEAELIDEKNKIKAQLEQIMR
ncbi:valine--tRNA ligase [Candidatus Oleimmundimicrobium sp.]|uniref:valine--tRNA ligase n=1 Tax=Candidatus Oleimmundimicrobium sp. TaxID=3060597 RepID=UPI002728413A|nr:valine--tRNA ligase [Candidatus Oleimmundimicrobium sp.]MDO8886125.1 valine--tRNA ligase [Candidatus Oleimmundimicrobium sp.]